MKANDLDKKIDEGEEDILEYFDLDKGVRINEKQKRVNVDFPQWMINSLDRESKRIGVTRQSLIKMWLADRLENRQMS
jgi:hypothetical protein